MRLLRPRRHPADDDADDSPMGWRESIWRAYLTNQDCDIRIVHRANLFDVCAELDPSLAAFTADDGG